MTTPELPQAAVDAAAAAIEDVHSSCDCPEHLDEYARAALTAALPHLGFRPEFGLRRRGDFTPHPYPSLDHAENARRTEPGRGPDGLAELFARYVTNWHPASTDRRSR